MVAVRVLDCEVGRPSLLTEICAAMPDFIAIFSHPFTLNSCSALVALPYPIGLHCIQLCACVCQVGNLFHLAPASKCIAQKPGVSLQGTGTISDLVAGLDWVASNAKQPAVATLSLGVPVGQVSPHCPLRAFKESW